MLQKVGSLRTRLHQNREIQHFQAGGQPGPHDIAKLLLCAQSVKCGLFNKSFQHFRSCKVVFVFIKCVMPDSLAGRVWLIRVLVGLLKRVNSAVVEFDQSGVIDFVFGDWGVVESCFGGFDHFQSVLLGEVALDQPGDM